MRKLCFVAVSSRRASRALERTPVTVTALLGTPEYVFLNVAAAVHRALWVVACEPLRCGLVFQRSLVHIAHSLLWSPHSKIHHTPLILVALPSGFPLS